MKYIHLIVEGIGWIILFVPTVVLIYMLVEMRRETEKIYDEDFELPKQENGCSKAAKSSVWDHTGDEKTGCKKCQLWVVQLLVKAEERKLFEAHGYHMDNWGDWVK